MDQLSISRDIHSVPIYDLDIGGAATYNFRTVASVEVTVAVPTDANRAIIFSSDHFFVGEATVILPVNDTPTLANGIENLTQVYTTGVTNLYFITRNNTDISVAFYS